MSLYFTKVAIELECNNYGMTTVYIHTEMPSTQPRNDGLAHTRPINTFVKQ